MSTRVGVNSNCPRCGKMTRSGYCRDCAGSSRAEEVENSIRWAMSNALAGNSTKTDMAKIARTLATEVDELQRRLDAVVKMLEHRKMVTAYHAALHGRGVSFETFWKDVHARAVAIAEGRDNG